MVGSPMEGRRNATDNGARCNGARWKNVPAWSRSSADAPRARLKRRVQTSIFHGAAPVSTRPIFSMRMIPIFIGVCLAALVAALVALQGGLAIAEATPAERTAAIDRHQLLGLSASVLLLISQCVVFVYFLGTGKAIKTAVEVRGLNPDLAARTRKLKGKTFPFATFSAIAVVAGSVLSGASSPRTHAITMLGALTLFLVSVYFEFRSIVENGKLMDQTGHDLERAETDIIQKGGSLADPDEAPLSFVYGRGLVVAGFSVWLVFAYQYLVMRANPQPWPWYILICVVSLLLGIPLMIAGRRRAGNAPGTGAQP